MESQTPTLELPEPHTGAAKRRFGVALKILAVAWVWLVFAGALIALTGREDLTASDLPEPVAVAIPRVAALSPPTIPMAPAAPGGAPRSVVEIQPPAQRAPGDNGLFADGRPVLREPVLPESAATEEPEPERERPQFVFGILPNRPPTTPPTAPPAPVASPAPVTTAPPAPVATAPSREETGRIALIPAQEPRAPRADPPRAAAPPAPPAPAPRQVAAVAPRAPVATRGGAWQQYRRAFNLADPRPRIAIVIGELGVGAAATEQALAQLPGGITLLFNSATPLPVLQDLIVRARAMGHEVLITLPLNPEAVPTASLSEARDVAGYAGNLLDRLGGAAGVVPSQVVGLAGAAALRATLGHAQRRGMMVVSRSGGPVLDTARQLQLPRLAFESTIDDQVDRGSIDARLAAVERRARETGMALAYGRPYAVTMQRLAAWSAAVEARGFALAPTTALVPRFRDR